MPLQGWLRQGPAALTRLACIGSFFRACPRRERRGYGAEPPSESRGYPACLPASRQWHWAAWHLKFPVFRFELAVSTNTPSVMKWGVALYNLLMKSSWDYNEWEENQGRLYDVSRLAERISEYTAEAIMQRFSASGGVDFDALVQFPCLFTYEGLDVVGSIGRISEMRSDRGQRRIIYTLPSIYPRIQLNEESVFEALGIETGRFSEQHRTHWAVKDIDLFEVTTTLLHQDGNVPVVLTGAEMNRVWGEGRRRKKLVFLSHRASYRRQVAGVREHLENQGLRCFVAHEDVNPSTIWQNEILNALNTMDVFVGFVTDDFHGGGWPDQEVGYACQRGVPRVLVKVEGADPTGMVAREQALTTGWESAGEEIIAHLKREGIL